jgi:hypothetical protein
MSAHDDNKVREESQIVIEAIERYDDLKAQLAQAKATGDALAYRALKHEAFMARRELARLTKEI